MNIEPYDDEQILIGPGRPPLDMLDDLLRYLVTVRTRFGNTVVTFDGRCTWGGNAMSVKDSQREKIDQLESQLAQVRTKLATIVCTGGCDSGVVLLSQEGTTHTVMSNGNPVQVYDHEYFSPLGDALIEAYELAGGVVEE